MKPRRSTQHAIVVALIEMFEHTHVRDCVERRTSGQNKSIAASRANPEINNVDQRVLEHHLGCGCFVEPLLRIRTVMNVFDTKDSIGVPQVLGRIGVPRMRTSSGV